MFEIEWFKNDEGFTFKGNLFSPISMLLHIEQLPGTKVIAKKSWFLTDDFEGYFTYENHLFLVETPYAEIEVCTIDKDISAEVRDAVLKHAAHYKRVSPLQFLSALIRYTFLPFNPSNK